MVLGLSRTGHNTVNSPTAATMATLDVRPRLPSAACFHMLTVRAGPILERARAQNCCLTIATQSAQLKKIQQKLVPERLRATNRHDSMLLRLPQELRDAIYELVLEDVRCMEPGPITYSACYSAPPVLFRVCHQLREEFAPKFWKNIFFWAMNESKIKQRMFQVEPKHIKAIRGIYHYYCYKVGDGRESKRRAMEVAEDYERTFGLQKGIVWVRCLIYSDDRGNRFLYGGTANSLGEFQRTLYPLYP